MMLRPLVIGIILSILSVTLYLIRGHHPAFFAILAVGAIAIIIGLFKK